MLRRVLACTSRSRPANLCYLPVVPRSYSPQGLLKLDPPYQQPAYQGAPLPFCQQHSCSCCNASHTLAILRTVQPVLADTSFPPMCAKYLAELACMPCDPEVGVGRRSALCGGFCSQVYEACRCVWRLLYRPLVITGCMSLSSIVTATWSQLCRRCWEAPELLVPFPLLDVAQLRLKLVASSFAVRLQIAVTI